MNAFRVGEIATLRNLANAPHLNGEECEIILPEAMRTVINPITGKAGLGLCYIIKTTSGKRGAVKEDNLKKRPSNPEDAAGRQAALQCIKKAMQPLEQKA
jgi:hypothetical protein